MKVHVNKINNYKIARGCIDAADADGIQKEIRKSAM
jgi:hypothetical protein